MAGNLIFLLFGFIFGFFAGVLYYFVKFKKLVIFIYDEVEALEKIIQNWRKL
jgi:hypothetical protein